MASSRNNARSVFLTLAVLFLAAGVAERVVREREARERPFSREGFPERARAGDREREGERGEEDPPLSSFVPESARAR